MWSVREVFEERNSGKLFPGDFGENNLSLLEYELDQLRSWLGEVEFKRQCPIATPVHPSLQAVHTVGQEL